MENMQTDLSQTQRKAIVDSTMKGQLAEIEFKYSRTLVEAGTYDQAAAPQPVHARVQTADDKAAPAPSTVGSIPIAGLVTSGAGSGFEERVEITKAIILVKKMSRFFE